MKNGTCKLPIIKMAAFTMFFGASVYAAAFEVLGDEALDSVVAGTTLDKTTEDYARIPIMANSQSGHSVEGEIILQRINNSATGYLTLQDGAQNNLKSLVNVNAVNSPVNVLLNLNININSEVGVVEQLNLQGRL